MIVLDTNLISSFMSAPPPDSVVAWLNDQEATSLYLTTISIAEIEFGLRIMPQGRRRRFLEERFADFIARAFEARVLSFDRPSAHCYGEIRAHRRAIGRPMSNFDGQIAAIARSTGFALATRNTKDFKGCDLELVNPFLYPT